MYMQLSHHHVNGICDFYETLRNDAVPEDIAVSLVATDFSTTFDVPMKEAEALVGMALHMNLGVMP